MQAAARWLQRVMWALSVVYAGLQVLTAVAVTSGNVDYSVAPLLVVTGLMIVAVILFSVWKRAPLVGLCLATAAGVAIVVLSFELQRTFPSLVSAEGTIDYGLTTAKMIGRHMGMVLVPVCMWAVWLCRRADQRAEQLRRPLSSEGYDLSGERIFKDRG